MILFYLEKTETFKKYRQSGYLDVFLLIYLFSIASFAVTFILALLSFSKQDIPMLFKLMLMSAFNNLFQVVLLSFIIIALVWRSGHEQQQ